MSILKIKDSQGNWVGVPTVKGDTGNGISSAILNDDYTLTLTFTDGTTYTTPSIRGEKGEKGEPATDMEIHICSASEYDAETRIPTIANPNDKTFYLVPTEDGTSPDLFTEWVYVNGAWEMFGSAKIDLSGYLTDVQINGTSVVQNKVANIDLSGIDQNAEDIASLEEDRYKPYVTDTASGSIASFPDGSDDIPLKSLVVNIDPVQDLHGYDSPWVGGGGKNKFDLNNAILAVGYGGAFRRNGYAQVNVYTTDTGIASDEKNINCGRAVCLGLLPAGTYIVSYVNKSGVTLSFTVSYTTTNVIPQDGPLERTSVVTTNNQSIQFEADGVSYYWLGMYSAAAESYRVDNIMVRLATESDATFSPYDNICLISGWEGMNITATNTNLRGGIDLANDIKARITSAVINTNEKTVSWGYNATHVESVRAPKVNFKPNTQYTFIFTVQNSAKRLNFRIYYTDGSVRALPDLTTTGKETVVIVTGVGKTVYSIVRQAQGGTTKLYYEESGVFEGVLTASDFQQFGQTIPINWQTEAGTVYGGKLDVLSGILTVYPEYDSYNGETLTGRWISDRDVYAEGTTPTIGAQVVNIGAEGTEYQLTPHEVNSLLGVNNIFADTGDTEVEYRADTELYISGHTPDVQVDDVQINGESVVQNGIANIDLTGIDQNTDDIADLKEELIGDVVDSNMLTVHFFNAPYGEVNADKTLDEMLEAIAQGKNMVGYYEYNLYGDTLIMRPSFYNLENKRITFSGINVGSSGAPIDILLFDFKRTGSSIGTRIRQAI